MKIVIKKFPTSSLNEIVPGHIFLFDEAFYIKSDRKINFESYCIKLTDGKHIAFHNDTTVIIVKGEVIINE